MPEEMIRKLIIQWFGKSAEDAIDCLAREFDVSVQAMTIRLTTLGFLR